MYTSCSTDSRSSTCREGLVQVVVVMMIVMVMFVVIVMMIVMVMFVET